MCVFIIAYGGLFFKDLTQCSCYPPAHRPFDGNHAAWGVGALGVLAVPILAVWPVATATPALRKRTVRAAVVMVAGLVPHEALKRLVIAIREIHRIPPFGFGLGLAVYIKNVSHGETHFELIIQMNSTII